MSKIRVKSVQVALLVLVMMGAGAVLVSWREPAARAGQEEKLPATDEVKIKALIDASRVGAAMKSLLKDRYEAAFSECSARWQDFMAGRGTLDILLGSSQRLRDAERELSPKKADQVAALEAHWKRMQKVEAITQGWFNAGRIAIQDLSEPRYFRLDAEIQLERAKASRSVGD